MAEIEYFVHPDFQGLGIGTLLLKTTLKEIYENKSFDNLPYSNYRTSIRKTSIEEVFLAIDKGNYPSIKMVKK